MRRRNLIKLISKNKLVFGKAKWSSIFINRFLSIKYKKFTKNNFVKNFYFYKNLTKYYQVSKNNSTKNLIKYSNNLHTISFYHNYSNQIYKYDTDLANHTRSNEFKWVFSKYFFGYNLFLFNNLNDELGIFYFHKINNIGTKFYIINYNLNFLLNMMIIEEYYKILILRYLFCLNKNIFKKI